ncbi:hypothetical protein K8B83_05275 [Shewanella inventionis]|uniref:DUF4224 domain-containing protein n=1 Tax=Shewanella inventionis TaxID=1738770 RepID=A0ABQ1IME5_9GAMM|nr:hypothetical protein [Shewanella inventionis]MCL1156566.1 hypothetical protein [Shewanella inventionis]UAL44259.1 hypothetical protein K8B83_05275 [Shewanella inventionis]GGB46516.1 hypothetical protein GCM10011607_03320 [Shewanella inventionis]
MTQVAYQLNERRNQEAIKHDEHWDLTTADQKLALYDLHRFGYRLLFVRHLPTGPVAIISQQDDIAAIYADGEVDLRPKITLRNMH